MDIFICLIIPFIGTTIGALLALFIKNELNYKIEKFLLGFASGVMVASSIWSLIIPSINLNIGYKSWLIPSIGLSLGIVFMILLDILIPKENMSLNLAKSTMLVLAVTIHNIPEGMAVGMATLGAMMHSLTYEEAFGLSLGIAIQNIPEGSIISTVLKSEGKTRGKSILIGVLSGVVEPLFGILALIISSLVSWLLPYVLSFAAGAMIYVVVEELIPNNDLKKHTYALVIGFMIGFIIMMILDVALS